MSAINEWYVIYTDCGREEKIKKKIEDLGLDGIRICNLSKLMTERKNNVITTKKRIIFSCYLFVSGSLDALKYQKITGIRGVRGFIREGIEPISIMNGNIVRLLELAMSYPGNVIPESKIAVDDSELNVIEGPLVGLEKLIKKTQFRRKRVFLDLALFGNRKLVALPASIDAK